MGGVEKQSGESLFYIRFLKLNWVWINQNIVYDIDLVDSPVFKLHAAWRILYAIIDAVKVEQNQVQN